MRNYLEAIIYIFFSNACEPDLIFTSEEELQTIEQARKWADSIYEDSSETSKKFGEFKLEVQRVYVKDGSITVGKNIPVDWKPRSQNDDI